MVRPSFIKSLNIDGDDKITMKDWIIEIVCYNQPVIFLRRVGRFILRIIRWIPVLWKQEEWDFGYTYDILEQKIKDLRDCIKKDTWHTEDCVKEELQQINVCLQHLDKYRNWTHYIEIPEPPEDFVRWTDCENGCKELHFTDEEHEAYQKANEFEEENRLAFWEDLKNHGGNWWT